MSITTDTPSVRSVFPADPVRWIWVRVKLYLAVLLVAIAGCLFFSGWTAAADANHRTIQAGFIGSVAIFLQVAAVVFGFYEIGHETHELGKRARHFGVDENDEPKSRRPSMSS